MADSYPRIDSSDRDHLINNPSRRSRCFGHPRLVIFLIVLSLIILGHGLAIYYLYFNPSTCINCMGLNVIALNTWGMPATFGSEFKTQRMKAIRDEVAKGDYDVFMLEELWMQGDHGTVASQVPKGYFMTEFRELALSTCDGRVGPTACSGLAIVSKFEFKEVEFNSFTYHGDPLKALVDGEWLARKGVGRVRIEPVHNVTIDIFVTHTAADPDPSHGYNNSYYRVRQVQELMDSYVSKSDADIVILGGDFNAEPEETEGSCYQIIKKHMTNSIQEIFYKLNEWLDSKFATYGNVRNTFTGGKYKPVTYDYIFHKTNKKRHFAWTSFFDLPFFKTFLTEQDIFESTSTTTTTASPSTATENGIEAEVVIEDTTEARQKRSTSKGKEISLSDHEGIQSTIYFWI